MKSMTGFSKIFFSSKLGKFDIELQSLNKRFLDFLFFLPKEFLFLEYEIRKILTKKIFRGFLTCRITFYKDIEKTLFFDVKILKSLKKRWEKICKDIGIEKELDLKFLKEELKDFKVFDDKLLEEEKNIILKNVEKVVIKLNMIRKKEGQKIAKDIFKKIQYIKSLVLKIEKLTPVVKKNFKKKINTKLKEFFKEKDERMLKEIAIFAEKVDIEEEVFRLKSHIEEFFSYLKKETSGRKMEFLLQEIVREANTISSKSLNAIISKYVVDIKAVAEKIKEQLQNIE